MSSNLSISSWNIQGLGDKCRDDTFLAFLEYDINILLESWKGPDPDFHIPGFKILQKCRQKKKRSRRYSGGIVVLYKSKFHKGITEMRELSASENRLWIKLDRAFLGLKKDLFICACYVPPVSSPYYEDDFLKLENEILNISNLGDILIVGDLNARISDTPDFIYNEKESQNSIYYQIIIQSMLICIDTQQIKY